MTSSSYNTLLGAISATLETVSLWANISGCLLLLDTSCLLKCIRRLIKPPNISAKLKWTCHQKRRYFFHFVYTEAMWRHSAVLLCSFIMTTMSCYQSWNMEHNCCWRLHFYPDHPFTTCCHGYFRLSGTREKGKGQTSLCSLELQEESLKPKAIPVALPEEPLPNDSHSNRSWLLLIFN